jgi:hypothetical protein
MSGITLAPIPLGTVVAERHFILWDSEGKKREIVVKLGSPVPIDPEYGLTPYMFRCPAQIIGLGVDKHVYSPAGEDAFAALCNALDLIGQILESQSKSLNLQNRHKRHDARTPPWVWQYLDGLGES